jgi:hypothetical protein
VASGEEHGAWSMEHGAWSMEHGAWSMEHGAWSMEHGAWSMEHGAGSREQHCRTVVLDCSSAKYHLSNDQTTSASQRVGRDSYFCDALGDADLLRTTDRLSNVLLFLS